MLVSDSYLPPIFQGDGPIGGESLEEWRSGRLRNDWATWRPRLDGDGLPHLGEHIDPLVPALKGKVDARPGCHAAPAGQVEMEKPCPVRWDLLGPGRPPPFVGGHLRDDGRFEGREDCRAFGVCQLRELFLHRQAHVIDYSDIVDWGNRGSGPELRRGQPWCTLAIATKEDGRRPSNNADAIP